MASLEALLATRPVLILFAVAAILFLVALAHVLFDKKKTTQEKLIWSLVFILASGIAPIIYLIGRNKGTAVR